MLSALAAELASNWIVILHPFGRLSLLLLVQTAAQAYLAVVVVLLYQKLRPDSPAAVAGDTGLEPSSGPRAELGLGVALRALLKAVGAGGLVLAAGFVLGALTEHRDCAGPTTLLASVVYWIVVVDAGLGARGPVPVLLTALALAAARFALLFGSLAWSEYAWQRRLPETDLILRGLSKNWSPLLVEGLALIPVLTILALAAYAYRTLRSGGSAGSLSTRGA